VKVTIRADSSRLMADATLTAMSCAAQKVMRGRHRAMLDFENALVENGT